MVLKEKITKNYFYKFKIIKLYYKSSMACMEIDNIVTFYWSLLYQSLEIVWYEIEDNIPCFNALLIYNYSSSF